MLRRLLILPLLFLPFLLEAETVSLKPSEALRIIFKDSQEVISEKKTLMPEDKARFEKEMGQPISKDTWNFYVARTGSRVDGYAVIDNEVGKTEPITFLTAITPDGRIRAVEVLVYREPIGGEVKDQRFLKQYQGKTMADPVRTGQDINNISGATLSSRAISRGVKRDLLLWNHFYGKK